MRSKVITVPDLPMPAISLDMDRQLQSLTPAEWPEFQRALKDHFGLEMDRQTDVFFLHDCGPNKPYVAAAKQSETLRWAWTLAWYDHRASGLTTANREP